MAAPKGAPTLAEFAASVVDSRQKKWCDTLPEDVQRQILDTDCSARTVANWLRSLGYAEATDQKVQSWRKAQRDRQPG